MRQERELPEPPEPGTDLWYQVKCEEYLANQHEFKWFIEKYFGLPLYESLAIIATAKQGKVLLDHLNNIWFYLPDNLFNIRENPPGWGKFLDIIET